MLTRENMSREKLQELLPKISFGVNAIQLNCTQDELHERFAVKMGQVIRAGRIRLIVLGANNHNLHLYRPENKHIHTSPVALGRSMVTTEIASLAQLLEAVFIHSNIQTILDDINVNRYRLTPHDEYVRIDNPGECEIGSGQFSVVYKVERNREVLACKVLKRRLDVRSDELHMLQILSDQASSAYLVRFKYYAIDGLGHEQLFFEYLEMGSLYDYWQPDNANYSHPSCYRILHHVICGIDVLHKLGIVHRDIKPYNVFLTRNANHEIDAKLGDFGCARFLHAMPGQVMQGSIWYYSPELWQHYDHKRVVMDPDKNSNYASDIYAFGVTVYETVTRNGIYSFLETAEDLQEAVLDRNCSPYHDVTASSPPVSIKLISIFNHCAAYDKASRPSAEEVKREFELGNEVMSDKCRQFWP